MRLWIAVGCVLLAAGCGDGAATVTQTVVSTAPATTTGPTTTQAATTPTTSPQGQELTVFLLRDGGVAPVTRTIEATPAVGTAALRELAKGPTTEEAAAGLSSAVPAGADFELTIADGTATVVGPEGLTDEAAAQIVYTLTQFPSVKTVRLNGGNAGDRSNWEKVTPSILVLTPTPGQTVTSPVVVAGTANTFEASLELELQDAAGKVLSHKFVTATSGTGTRGTFEAQLPYTAPPGPGKLVAFESSAENGQRIHIVAIPLQLG